MPVQDWTDENSSSVTLVRDVGSSDSGDANAVTVSNITDGGSYYSFNGTNSYLRWSGNVGNEANRDYKIRFRLNDKNKNAEQVMWKSGGNTNGVALGLDASNNLGIFTRKDSSLYSITLDNTNFEENTWYILYASETRVSLWNETTENFVEAFGNITIGEGSADEAMGAGVHSTAASTSVISTSADPTAFFDGDIDFLATYAQGGLDFPKAKLDGWDGENSSYPLISRNLGSNYQGAAGADTITSVVDGSDYYTFNGTSSVLAWNNDFDESAYQYKAKFRVHNKAKGIAQVIWKAGGNTNGCALGIDSNGNLGVFSRDNYVLSENTFSSSQYEEDVWYILYAINSKILLYNTENQVVIESVKTIDFGADGTSGESIGGGEGSVGTAANTCVIDDTLGNDPVAFFEGDIDFVGIYNTGELDIPTASGGPPAPAEDIEGVGGGFGSTITLSDPARLLILNESDLTMEYSKTVSGTIDVTGLTEESKIILVRETNSGETFGYGSVEPIQLGPTVPFTETFDGPDGTRPDAELWTLSGDITGYQDPGTLDGNGALYTYFSTGPNERKQLNLDFNYAITGDFEIETSQYFSGTKAVSGYEGSQTFLEIRNGSDYLRIGNSKVSTGSNWKLIRGNVGGVSISDNDLKSPTSERDPTYYKIRRTGSTVYLEWSDSVYTDWGWDENYYDPPRNPFVVNNFGTQPVNIKVVIINGTHNGYWAGNLYQFDLKSGTVTARV